MIASRSQPHPTSVVLTQQHTGVDRKLLRWLLRYPLQRVEDLTLALQVSQNTVYRHLTKLIAEQLVESITPSLTMKSTCRFYYLNNTGLARAASYEQAEARTLARTWGADELGLLRLLPRIAALVSLQDLINALILSAPALFAHARGYRAELTWQWQRDYQQRFLAQGRFYTCHADAALILHRKAHPELTPDSAAYFSVLICYDPGLWGSHDHQLITHRLEAVLRYRESIKHRLPISQFPALLVLVPTERQREHWQQKASALANALHTAPLTGAIVTVAAQETIQAIAGLPWQKLSSPTPCRLREIFTVLSPEALLPGLLEQNDTREAALPSATTQKKLIQGNFAQRASTIALMPDDDSEQERMHVALLRLCFSQRHIELLEMLYVHPLLTTEELSIWQDVKADSTTRYLYELRRYSCLEQWQTEYGERWHLSARGLRFIAALHHTPLSALAEVEQQAAPETASIPVQRGLRLLKKRLRHTVGLYSFFTRLYQDAHGAGNDHQLQWWETGARCELHFQEHGTWQTLRPDAMFLYKAGQRQLLSWLEWSDGGSHQQVFGTKLKLYAQCARVHAWKVANLPVLPVLHIVIPDSSHMQQMTQLLSEHLAACGLLVRLTTASHINKQGPLAAIWTQVAPAPAAQKSRAAPARQTLLDIRQGATHQVTRE